jgi:hypothetical protein
MGMGLCASTTKVRINGTASEDSTGVGGGGANNNNTNNNNNDNKNNRNDTNQINTNRYFFSEMDAHSLIQKKINKAVDQILPTVRSVIMKK